MFVLNIVCILTLLTNASTHVQGKRFECIYCQTRFMDDFMADAHQFSCPEKRKFSIENGMDDPCIQKTWGKHNRGSDQKRTRQALIKKEQEEAVEQYKKDLAEKAANEKLVKEEADNAYKQRVEDDWKEIGDTHQQIQNVLSDKQESSTGRPTYTRMSRRHLSVETLDKFHVDYEYDQVRHTTSLLTRLKVFVLGSRVCPDQALGPRARARQILERHARVT